MFNGKGKYTWSDKREYIGEWEMNQMNGYGIFKWPDGRKYQGDYKKDKKEGFGVFFWPDGRIFKFHFVKKILCFFHFPKDLFSKYFFLDQRILLLHAVFHYSNDL